MRFRTSETLKNINKAEPQWGPRRPHTPEFRDRKNAWVLTAVPHVRRTSCLLAHLRIGKLCQSFPNPSKY